MQIRHTAAPLSHSIIPSLPRYEKPLVYEVEGSGRNKTQRIVIYYRFVGYLDLPVDPTQYLTENTRKGVAVRYLPKAMSA